MFRLLIAAILITRMTLAFAAESQTGAASDKPINASTGLEAGDKAINGKALQEQYGGLVTDQTITVAGQDFYQYFIALWRDKPLNELFVVAIRERPSARWGNRILVEYAQRRVFEAVLPSSRSNIKSMSETAAEISYKNVVDAEVQRKFFRDHDLGPDEL